MGPSACRSWVIERLMKQIRLRQAHEADATPFEMQNVGQDLRAMSSAHGDDPRYRQRHVPGSPHQSAHGAEQSGHPGQASRRYHQGDDPDRDDMRPPDSHSNMPSSENPMVPGSHRPPRRDRDNSGHRGSGDGKGKGGKEAGGKGDGKDGNTTSADNPLAPGNYWGEVRGLPARPPVFG